MKIVHVNGYFSDAMMYQENYLLKGLVELGHEAVLITGRFEPEFSFNKSSRIKNVGVTNYFGSKIYRVKEFFEIKNSLVFFVPFFNILSKEKPDIIFFHGISPNILYGLIYKLLNKDVKLHLDFHTTFSNSGQSRFSSVFHSGCKLFCKIFHRQFEKIFCIAPECKEFAIKVYSLPEEHLTILPLPGTKYEDTTYNDKRDRFRSKHKVQGAVVFCHVGKMPEDKETLLVLKAFSNVRDKNVRLFLGGSVESDFKNIIEKYCNQDDRVTYLGWLSQESLSDLMCGSDTMIQPGSLSQVFVDAICSRLPLILDDTPQGNYLLSNGNGVVCQRSIESIQDAFNSLLDERARNKFKANAIQSSEVYDYRYISMLTVQ